jgi:uroporphyrinogen III methyltransferase/synthase
MFTSENGVRYFAERFLSRGGDWRRLSKFIIGAIGSGTAEALRKYGLRADFIPQKYTIADFSDELLNKFDWEAKEVVRVRGDLGDNSLEKALTQAGAEVFPLQVYRTIYPKWDAGMMAAFREVKIDALMFTSASTVKGLFKIIGRKKSVGLLNRTKVFSIGPSTTDTLLKNGVENILEANIQTTAGLLETIVKNWE